MTARAVVPLPSARQTLLPRFMVTTTAPDVAALVCTDCAAVLLAEESPRGPSEPVSVLELIGGLSEHAVTCAGER